MRALYVGRFQPFHKGHLKVARQIADEVGEVVIAVGSAQESHTLHNPFTAGERVSMITKAVEGLDTTFYAIPVEDVNRNSVWTSHIRSICPPFETVYTNNPLVVRLFKEEGTDVRQNHLYEREKYSGKEIRSRMLENDDWRPLVPGATEAVVDEVNGVERLRDLDDDDYS